MELAVGLVALVIYVAVVFALMRAAAVSAIKDDAFKAQVRSAVQQVMSEERSRASR